MCPRHAKEREQIARWSERYAEKAFLRRRPDATAEDLAHEKTRRDDLKGPNKGLVSRAAKLENEITKSRKVQPENLPRQNPFPSRAGLKRVARRAQWRRSKSNRERR